MNEIANILNTLFALHGLNAELLECAPDCISYIIIDGDEERDHMRFNELVYSLYPDVSIAFEQTEYSGIPEERYTAIHYILF